MLKRMIAVVVTAVLTVGAATAAANSVTDVQRRLGVTADGVMGPQTKRAIKRFQRRHHLTVDGIAGPQTLRALGLSATAARAAAKPRGTTALLEAIAECESGGVPTTVSDDGRFLGKYQMLRSTWRSLGGRGNPAKASEAEQDRRARRLYRQQGLKPWPACGAALQAS